MKYRLADLPYTLWLERDGMSAKLVAAFADYDAAFEYGSNLDHEAGWYIRRFDGRKMPMPSRSAS